MNPGAERAKHIRAEASGSFHKSVQGFATLQRDGENVSYDGG